MCRCVSNWVAAVIRLPHRRRSVKQSKQRWRNRNGHPCLTNSLSPPSPFYSPHWRMNLAQQQVKKECIFVSHPTEAEHLKVPCVIFIDGCREAGVSLGLQQKEGSISPRLCNTVPWLWGNWRVCSVLACNPICVRLCPSTTLLPIKQSYFLILCGCPPKIQQQIWYCFISAVSSLSSWLFVLNFYVFFIIILLCWSLISLQVSDPRGGRNVIIKTLASLLFSWQAFKLFSRQTFTFIWTPVKSPKLSLELQQKKWECK